MYAGNGVLLLQLRPWSVDDGSVQPEDKLEFYSYILHYLDDILYIHSDPDSVLLKPGSVGSPDMYLGTKLKCMQLQNGIWALFMSPSKYVLEAVRICKEYIARHLSKEYRLWKRADNPFEYGYYSELDASPVLGQEEASHYQSLIGAMRLTIEIGCIDINIKVSLLSLHSAMPRQGGAFGGGFTYHGIPEAQA